MKQTKSHRLTLERIKSKSCDQSNLERLGCVREGKFIPRSKYDTGECPERWWVLRSRYLITSINGAMTVASAKICPNPKLFSPWFALSEVISANVSNCSKRTSDKIANRYGIIPAI
jgi:hypothetical protein